MSLWDNLVAMTVLVSPKNRLERTRIAIATQARRDVKAWKKWCASVIEDGAGMIVVSNPGFDLQQMNEILSAAREVSPRGLVAAKEPVDATVRADVIHLDSVEHVKKWSGRLVGCAVSSVKAAEAAYKAGCAYLVADMRIESLVAEMAGLARTHPDLVWFVSGCTTLADLEKATSLGARRVWMEAELDVAVRVWANHCRHVSAGEHHRLTGDRTDAIPWMKP